MSARTLIRGESALRNMTSGDRTLLARGNRSSAGGKCVGVYSRTCVWYEFDVAFSFSTTSQTVDLLNPLPNNDFILLPTSCMKLTSWTYATATSGRNVLVSVGLLDSVGPTFRYAFAGSVTEPNWTGAGPTYTYTETTATTVWGMQAADHNGYLFSDGDGPGVKESLGPVGALIPAEGGTRTSFTKFQVVATDQSATANLKTGNARIYLAIDFLGRINT